MAVSLGDKRRRLSSFSRRPLGLSLARRLRLEPLESRELLTASGNDTTASTNDGSVFAGLDFNVQAALQHATDLTSYATADLNATHQWVVGLPAGGSDAEAAAALGAVSQGPTNLIPNTYFFQFPSSMTGTNIGAALHANSSVAYSYPLVPHTDDRKFVPNDPLYSQEWSLHNTGQTGGTVGADADLQTAWDTAQGTGVVIGIVDDGLQYTHPDLAPAYRPGLSTDFNGNDSDPAPNVAVDFHGTAVAGVAAGRGSNGLGVTGAAPQAQLAGIRLIDAPVTDAQEAAAMGWKSNNISIYSNSWGPADASSWFASPGPLFVAAVQAGVTTGRNGLGSLYVWAGGNGAQGLDDVNYDGYANNPNTIAIGALDHNGKRAVYSEPGSALFISTPGGDGSVDNITTTDLLGANGYSNNDYTSGFDGTSAATPLASGVMALILQTNPTLTSRDVQYILAKTAKKTDPTNAAWSVNAAGYNINENYGFGSIDAAAAVALAKTWTNVPAQQSFASALNTVNTAIPDNSAVGVTTTFNVAQALQLERVQVNVQATHQYRGDLAVTLTSPTGVVSHLSQAHALDAGVNLSWVFDSVRDWGESSVGTWTLNVADRAAQYTGTFVSARMNFIGVPILTAVNDAAFTVAGAPVNIAVLANDYSQLSPAVASSVAIVAQPSTGTAVVNASTGAITFTPPATGAGPFTFTYNFKNQAGQTSNTATVTVSIDQRPVANNDTVTTGQNTAVNVNVAANDTDPDGTINTGSIVVVSQPAHGAAAFNATLGAIVYTPAVNYAGPDSFSYTINDNLGAASNVGTVNVTVTPVNVPPVAVNDVVTGALSAPLDINVLNNDSDVDNAINAASVVIVGGAAHGTLVVGSAGIVTYTPTPGYSGPDSFIYHVSDALGAVSNNATVSITVANINIPPVAANDTATTNENTATQIQVLSNDTDADTGIAPGTVVIAVAPANGVATVSSTGVVTYTPALYFFGTDTFKYTVKDTGGQISNQATVNVTVNHVNQPPQAIDDFLSAPTSTPVTANLLANDFDPDGAADIDPQSASIVGQPQSGTATVSTAGVLTYTPSAGFIGLDRVGYQIKDKTGLASNTGYAYIVVGPASSLSGWVYVDTNNDGLHAASEMGLAGVTVTLNKLDGPLRLTETVTTGADGSYNFGLLPAGHYTITKASPAFYLDGKATAGTPAPAGASTQNSFVDIALPSGVNAGAFNFAEQGLRLDFVQAFLSRRTFFSSTDAAQNSLNLSRGDVWIALTGAPSSKLAARAGFDGAQGTATLTLYDSNLTQLATSSTTNPNALTYATTPGQTYLLKVSGNNPAVSVRTFTVAEVVAWHNAQNASDVNDDAAVTPLDALLVINALNSTGSGALAGRSVAAGSFLDVNNDGFLSPIDALLIINQLNTASAASAASRSLSPAMVDAAPAVDSTVAAAAMQSASQSATDQALADLTAGDALPISLATDATSSSATSTPTIGALASLATSRFSSSSNRRSSSAVLPATDETAQ